MKENSATLAAQGQTASENNLPSLQTEEAIS